MALCDDDDTWSKYRYTVKKRVFRNDYFDEKRKNYVRRHRSKQKGTAKPTFSLPYDPSIQPDEDYNRDNWYGRGEAHGRPYIRPRSPTQVMDAVWSRQDELEASLQCNDHVHTSDCPSGCCVCDV